MVELTYEGIRKVYGPTQVTLDLFVKEGGNSLGSFPAVWTGGEDGILLTGEDGWKIGPLRPGEGAGGTGCSMQTPMTNSDLLDQLAFRSALSKATRMVINDSAGERMLTLEGEAGQVPAPSPYEIRVLAAIIRLESVCDVIGVWDGAWTPDELSTMLAMLHALLGYAVPVSPQGELVVRSDSKPELVCVPAQTRGIGNIRYDTPQLMMYHPEMFVSHRGGPDEGGLISWGVTFPQESRPYLVMLEKLHHEVPIAPVDLGQFFSEDPPPGEN